MNQKNRYEDIKNMFAMARQNQKAIPGFNFDSLEIAKGISNASKKMNYPVLLMCTGSAGQSLGFEHAKNIAKQIRAENKLVITHWDHIFDYSLALSLIESGFDSVMYDGSKLDFETNVKNSSHFVKVANKYNVFAECEIGKIGGKEDDENLATQDSTSPSEAIEYFNKVKPDLFAFSLGTSHGLGKKEIKIEFDNIKKIKTDLIETNLVLHGGSGVQVKDLQKAIKNGIVKINVGTSLKKAAIDAMKKFIQQNPNNYDVRKLNAAVVESVEQEAIKIIEICM